MKNRLRLTALAVTFALGSLVQAQTLQVQDPVEIPDPVASHNGKDLSRAEFLEFVSFIVGNDDTSILHSKEQVNNLVEAYLLQKALAERAVENKLDKDPKFEAQLRQITSVALAEAELKRFAESKEITEEEIRKEYDQQVSAIDTKEYKAAHILVEDEAAAKELAKEIAEGKTTFEEAAKEHSIDPGSKESGGDLGWFTANVMVPEFSDAVKELKKGELTKEPVKSQFGYHIIQLEDIREAQNIETYENARGAIEQLLIENNLQDYIQEINEALKIDYKLK